MSDSYLLIGGLLNDVNKVSSLVLKINLTEETVEELATTKKPRFHHSCELLEGSSVVLISGGTDKILKPTSNMSTVAVPEDELYYIYNTSQSVLLSPASSLYRYQHRLIRLQETVFAVGGLNTEGSPVSLVEKFNTTTRSWQDDGEHILSNHTGEVAVTAFPLESIDCVAGCTCGISRLNPAARILNGKEAKVTPHYLATLFGVDSLDI